MPNLHCFIVIADDKDFFMLNYSQSYCKIKQFWVKKFIKLIEDQIEFDKIFDERNIYLLLFNSKPVIHISSFRIVNQLYCRAHFSNITLIGANTKYRSLYLLGVT